MFRHTKIFFNNNTETECTRFGTYLGLLFNIVAFDIKALVVSWHQYWCIPSLYHVAVWLFNQNLSGLHHLRSVYQQSAHFLKQEKFRWYQVRDVRRMLEDVPMELLTQQGFCLPGSMRTCNVVQQNNSTRELASSAR